MVELAFVVLQYGGFQETKRCLQSIRNKIDTESFAVVVVDNCSPDTSYERVKQEIESYNDERFVLMRTKGNLGFAKGNNLGIAYARQKLNARFVAVINNDIELLSENMLQILRSKYNDTGFAVLGPLILSGDGRYTTNPMANGLFSLPEIEHEIEHTKRILCLNKYGLYNVYALFKRSTSKRKETILEEYKKDGMDVKLHGCFLVFSDKYFERFEGLNPNTFLYMEEDILLLAVKSSGLHTLFTPDLCAFHKEGASTATIKSAERIKFIYSNRLKSQELYRELLLEANDIEEG